MHRGEYARQPLYGSAFPVVRGKQSVRIVEDVVDRAEREHDGILVGFRVDEPARRAKLLYENPYSEDLRR